MATGKTERARAILAKYHGNGDTNAPLVALQMREFEESIGLDASDKRWFVVFCFCGAPVIDWCTYRWDYSELVNTRNARYRTFMMLLMGFFGQWSGNGLGYFLTILFKNAGANTQERRLVLNFINTLVSASGALLGTSLTDKVGRRTMWFWGTLMSAGMLAVVTGMAFPARFSVSEYHTRLHREVGSRRK